MNTDILYQGIVVVIALAAAYFTTSRRWSPPRAFVVAVAASFVIAGFLAHDMFHHMRLLAWLIFVHLPVWLCLLAFHVRAQRWLSRASMALSLLIVVVAVDAFWIEPRWLEHTTVRIESPTITRPIKIVVLADLQTDEVGEYQEHVFQDIAAFAPDLLLMPGDFLQVYGEERPAQVEKLRALFRKVAPPLGSWAVRGNVDPDDYGEIFSGTDVRFFTETDTVQVTEGIRLTGLSLEDSFDSQLKLSPPDTPGFHIVMGHAPDFALGSDVGELLLAGHTHGGQVQVPLIGPLITLSAVPRAWAHGRTDLPGGARTLLVSRGVGMERGFAPRLRFLCRPQLLIVEVVPSKWSEPI